jgi:hypothetical protein
MDNNIYSIVENVGKAFSIPMDILYPIVMHESGGNPSAHAKTDSEDSRGLFQVNINAHPEANGSLLFNPEYNARYQIPALAKVYNEGVSKGLKGADLAVYVERYGERPQWNSNVENSIRGYYNEYVTKVAYNPMLTPALPIPAPMLEPKEGEDVKKGVGNSVNNALDAVGEAYLKGFKDLLKGGSFYLAYVLLFILLIFLFYLIFVK